MRLVCILRLERVRKVLSEMVKFLVIDQLIPTPRMVAIDCMNVALLHNVPWRLK